MKKYFGLLCAITLFLTMPGCGGSSEPTNMAEGVEQSELEKYEEAIKAEEEAAGAAMAAGLEETK